MDNVWAWCFSHFFRERSFKIRQNPRVDFFLRQEKTWKDSKRRFPLTVAEIFAWWIVYIPIYSRRRGRFVNSLFPNKKIWPKNGSLFVTNKFESKCLQRFYVWMNECYRKTTSYLEQLSCHFCQHFIRRTTQQTLLALNLASQEKKKKQSSTFLRR